MKLADYAVLIQWYASKDVADCDRFSLGTEKQIARLVHN